MCAICSITNIPVCATGSCGIDIPQILGMGAMLGATGVGTMKLWRTPPKKTKQLDDEKI